MTRRRVALAGLAVTALALTGCGRGDATPDDVLRAASSKTADVRSATLTLAVDTVGGTGRGFGFTLAGPFDIGGDGALPRAELTYEQRLGGTSERVQFLSTGEAAYVVVDAVPYQLPDAALSELRGTGGETGDGGLAGLRLDRWVTEPQVKDGPEVDGVSTTEISGPLDVAVALSDLTRLASRLGASGAAEALSDVDAEALQRVGTGSTLRLWVGEDDDVLRRLEVDIHLDTESRDALPPALRALVPVTMSVRLELSDLGSDVEVAAPSSARPFGELPRG